MPDDLKIKVTTPGARKAKRDLRGVADAQKKVGGAGKRAGKDAAAGMKKTEGVVRRLTGSLKGLLSGFMGLAGAKMVIASLRMEMERLDQANIRSAESLRAVLALSSLKGERAEVQAAIFQMAADASRKPGETASAYYTMLGGTAGMGPKRQMGLMQQALLMGKTDPRANLESLVNLFSTIASQQPGMSAEQIGNLVSRTIEQAKSTPEEMAQYLPDVLSAAQAGKVPISTATAMFSFATRKGGGVAKSGQAVKSTMLGLLAPSPDVQKQLVAYGFPAGADLETRLAWMATNAGRLPPELQAALGGRRGIQAVASIAAAPREFAREQQLMRGAMGAEGSLLQQRIADMYSEMPAQRYLDQIKRNEILTELEDIDPARMKALSRKSGRNLWMRRNLPFLVRKPVQYGDEAIRAIFGKSWLEAQQETFEILSSPDGPVKGVVTYIQKQFTSGTHYHQNDKRDPAGRPREPVGKY